jgi:hypothetical protein
MPDFAADARLTTLLGCEGSTAGPGFAMGSDSRPGFAGALFLSE